MVIHAGINNGMAELRVDGVLSTRSGSTNPIQFGDTLTANYAYHMFNRNLKQTFFGDVSEMVVISRAITEQERASVTTYLHHTAGLTPPTATPTPAPTAAPTSAQASLHYELSSKQGCCDSAVIGGKTIYAGKEQCEEECTKDPDCKFFALRDICLLYPSCATATGSRCRCGIHCPRLVRTLAGTSVGGDTCSNSCHSSWWTDTHGSLMKIYEKQ